MQKAVIKNFIMGNVALSYSLGESLCLVLCSRVVALTLAGQAVAGMVFNFHLAGLTFNF